MHALVTKLNFPNILPPLAFRMARGVGDPHGRPVKFEVAHIFRTTISRDVGKQTIYVLTT